MELIDKKKAKQALVDLPPELDAITVQKAIETIGRVKVEEDVAPVMRGWWVYSSDRPDTIICSCCDCAFDVWKHESKYFFYCPHCGAKMDVENSVDNVEKG